MLDLAAIDSADPWPADSRPLRVHRRLIVSRIGVTVFPLYLMAALAVMIVMHETLARVQYTEQEGV